LERCLNDDNSPLDKGTDQTPFSVPGAMRV
jgi:hypothetical protein